MGSGLQSVQPPRSVLPLFPLQDHCDTWEPSNLCTMPGCAAHIHSISIHLPSTQSGGNTVHHLPFPILTPDPGGIRFRAAARWVSSGFQVVPSECAVCTFP